MPDFPKPQCRVIYVSTAVEVEWWANRFLDDPWLAVVGFDIEWRVTFKTGAHLRVYLYCSWQESG